jgi:uncharacterized protein YqgQ
MEVLAQNNFESLIDFLRYSPTGDNSQHWSFSCSDNKVDIYLIPERSEHDLNQENCASYLALGALIQNAKVWAASNNKRIHHQVCEESDFPKLAILSIENAPSTSLFTKDDLMNRSTNRKLYQAIPDFKSFVQKLQDDLQIQDGSLYFKKDFSEDFKKHIYRAERYVWVRRETFVDIAKWIRYSDEEAKRLKDGFSLANVHLKAIDGIMIRLLLKFPMLANLLNKTIIRVKTHFDINKLLKNYGHAVCVSAPDCSTKSMIEVGMKMQAVWLYLTKHSYAAQPQTLASLLPAYLSSRNKLPDNCPQGFEDFFNEGPSILRKEFGMSDNEFPVWMLRFGQASPLLPKESTYRKDIDFFIKKEEA